MSKRVLLSVAVASVVIVIQVQADAVFVRGKDTPFKGDVKVESAKEVVIGKETLPGGDVIDVQYFDSIKPIDLTTVDGPYRLGTDAEKELKTTTDPTKRRAAINRAIKYYTLTLTRMTPHKAAGRHLEYKIATFMVQLASIDQLSPAQGVAKLQDFKSKHQDCWQINQVMPLIAQLQMDEKDYKGAAQTFQEMAEMTVFSDELRRDAELNVVQVAVKANDYPLAQKRLDALAKKAASNPVFAARVKLTRAELFALQKKFDEALPILNQVVKETTDKQIKALAHNTLGECLYRADRYNDALWEFLWVDTVYNQDKGQHAKALYYLWQTFEKLNNAERAQECREMLLNDARFTGTEFQRIAQAKQK